MFHTDTKTETSAICLVLVALLVGALGCERVPPAEAAESDDESTAEKESETPYRSKSFDEKVEALRSIPEEPKLEVEEAPPPDSELDLSEKEWRKRLTDEEFHILREEGTERPGSGDLLDEKRGGVYRCAGCGAPLFSSRDKYDSETGWPSFTKPYQSGRIEYRRDPSGPFVRVETVCARCGGHLGHVFADGPDPTGKRYCINSVALDFDPDVSSGD